jgi:hypothetical protein
LLRCVRSGCGRSSRSRRSIPAEPLGRAGIGVEEPAVRAKALVTIPADRLGRDGCGRSDIAVGVEEPAVRSFARNTIPTETLGGSGHESSCALLLQRTRRNVMLQVAGGKYYILLKIITSFFVIFTIYADYCRIP